MLPPGVQEASILGLSKGRLNQGNLHTGSSKPGCRSPLSNGASTRGMALASRGGRRAHTNLFASVLVLAVASGLLSWGHIISSDIVDLIAQILLKFSLDTKLNWTMTSLNSIMQCL